MKKREIIKVRLKSWQKNSVFSFPFATRLNVGKEKKTEGKSEENQNKTKINNQKRNAIWKVDIFFSRFLSEWIQEVDVCFVFHQENCSKSNS